MTLPGNRVREGTPVDVYDRLSARWSWDPDRCLFVCTDPTYNGEPVTEPGAIPAGRQPTFAQPPNEVQKAAMAARPDER